MTQLYRFGLVGHSISYSLSPKIFEALFSRQGNEGDFQIVDIPPDQFETEMETLRSRDGFSVTVPYKEVIIPLMRELSKEAKEIGAVNSVKVEKGNYFGHNTDAEGFIAPLRQRSFSGNRLLVLGHGGAAKAVVWALFRDYPRAEISICGRDLNKVDKFIKDCTNSFGRSATLRGLTYGDLSDDDNYELIINCTPVGGMNYPDMMPISENFRFHGCRVCYDLNYRPERPIWMSRAEAAGCAIIGGLPMLVRQAILSYTFWTGSKLDIEAAINEIMTIIGGEIKGGVS